MGSRTIDNADKPYPIVSGTTEWERLDDMHKGIDNYLGNKLSYAPIENPTRILEIGCGSGAWAIQAAQTYPQAEVIAVDIAPLPPRPLPTNLKYQNVNVVHPFPFESASFDVVHTRFVLVHLPHFADVLKRMIDLIKPGGWLLVEDIDHYIRGDTGPGIAKFYEVYHDYTALRNVDPDVGTKLESVLKASGALSEVHAKKVVCPFSGRHQDLNQAGIGKVMGLSFRRAYQHLNPGIVAHGLTKEIQQGWYDEVEDPERAVYADLFITWSRKRE